jgi:DNA-binding NarL/FixJ family response regulator
MTVKTRGLAPRSPAPPPRDRRQFEPAELAMSPVAEDVDDVDLEPTDATRHLLRLMRTGAIDEAIARELGVSVRTVHRRITRLQNLLGVRSRFQLGVIARERDWV